MLPEDLILVEAHDNVETLVDKSGLVHAYTSNQVRNRIEDSEEEIMLTTVSTTKGKGNLPGCSVK